MFLFISQTVSFSEETKDEINLDVLDDVAWCQIQRLTVIKQVHSTLENFVTTLNHNLSLQMTFFRV